MILKLFCLLIVLSSCSFTPADKKRTIPSSSHFKSCFIKQDSIEAKHVALSIRSQPALINCFKNYIRFLSDKDISIPVCHSINLSKDGRTTFAQVRGIERKIPADLKLCLEQALWTQNLEKLQLSEKIYVNFPLIYSGKK